MPWDSRNPGAHEIARGLKDAHLQPQGTEAQPAGRTLRPTLLSAQLWEHRCRDAP